VPSNSKSESIFAAGRSADNYNSYNNYNSDDGDGERTVDSNESGNLLDLTNGIFNFDNDIAEDLANSIDENYAMLLNMDCSELGLGLEDPYLNDRGLSVENQEQEVLNQGEEAAATPSSNDNQIETSFELNQVDDDIMNILEGIEEMPWFDDLLH